VVHINVTAGSFTFLNMPVPSCLIILCRLVLCQLAEDMEIRGTRVMCALFFINNYGDGKEHFACQKNEEKE